MRILCIGNSFSQDATRYLHQIAESAGEEMEVWNLFVGGCSLEWHWQNIQDRAEEYLLEINGESTERKVDAVAMLEQEEWDVVTLQQVSNKSVDYPSYQPYLEKINTVIREKAPSAKRMIHQTWAYEQGCVRLDKELGGRIRQEMFRDLEKAYEQAAADIAADGIIPSGAVFEAIQSETSYKMHRDGYHASLGLGRYALGLTWYGYLTGKPVREISFDCLDEEVSAEALERVRGIAERILKVRRP